MESVKGTDRGNGQFGKPVLRNDDRNHQRHQLRRKRGVSSPAAWATASRPRVRLLISPVRVARRCLIEPSETVQQQGRTPSCRCNKPDFREIKRVPKRTPNDQNGLAPMLNPIALTTSSKTVEGVCSTETVSPGSRRMFSTPSRLAARMLSSIKAGSGWSGLRRIT